MSSTNAYPNGGYSGPPTLPQLDTLGLLRCYAGLCSSCCCCQALHLICAPILFLLYLLQPVSSIHHGSPGTQACRQTSAAVQGIHLTPCWRSQMLFKAVQKRHSPIPLSASSTSFRMSGKWPHGVCCCLDTIASLAAAACPLVVAAWSMASSTKCSWA